MTPCLFLMTDQHRVDTLGAYGNPHVRHARPRPAGRDRHPVRPLLHPDRHLHAGAGQPAHRAGPVPPPAAGQLRAQRRLPGGPAPTDTFTFPEALREQGYQLGLIGKWHVGDRRTAAYYGFDGPDLPGWHNPVDHPDYLAYLEERGLPPYRISDPIRGTTPNGSPGNLLAARLHQPVEATFEHYLATRAIEQLERYAADRPGGRSSWPPTSSGRTCPTSCRTSTSTCTTPSRSSCRRRSRETFEGKPPVQRNYSAHWTFDTMPIEVTRKLIAVYWGYVALIDEQIGRILDAHATSWGWPTTPRCSSPPTTASSPARTGCTTRARRCTRTSTASPGSSGSRARRRQVRNEFVSLLDCTATILDLAGLRHRAGRGQPQPAAAGARRAPGVARATSSASSTATTSRTRSG